MTRRRYDFMDAKRSLVSVLFWAAVIALLLLLALGAFMGGCRVGINRKFIGNFVGNKKSEQLTDEEVPF